MVQNSTVLVKDQRGIAIGSNLIQATTQKIRIYQDWMKAAKGHQKSYADKRQRPLEFKVRDQVFLKVSPTNSVTRFGMTGKLSIRYIKLYPIIQWVEKVAYWLELLAELPRVYNVFHVSQLHKCIHDPSHVIKSDPIQLQEDLSSNEQPIQILDRKEQQLCKKIVLLMKVLWANHKVSEFTWERE